MKINLGSKKVVQSPCCCLPFHIPYNNHLLDGVISMTCSLTYLGSQFIVLYCINDKLYVYKYVFVVRF